MYVVHKNYLSLVLTHARVYKDQKKNNFSLKINNQVHCNCVYYKNYIESQP